MNFPQRSKVLIVDDSLALCRFLERALSLDPDLEVVGFAHDAFEARSKIKSLEPDVLTLDIGLPGMNGLTFLSNLMRLRPMPVVVLSAMVENGDSIEEEAMRNGAFAVLSKRQAATREELDVYVREIIQQVKNAVARHDTSPAVASTSRSAVEAQALSGFASRIQHGRPPVTGLHRLIAIGSSTGGPEALREVLSTLNAPQCAVLIAQHMPARFLGPFAERLDKHFRQRVKLMEDNERIIPGGCYLAPGDCHMIVSRQGDQLIGKLLDSPPANGHRPSVGMLFDSVTDCAASGAVGVLLTGMGDDGASELARLHDAGAATLVQDEQTSVVWGMPGRAASLGAADAQLPLTQIGHVLTEFLGPKHKAA